MSSSIARKLAIEIADRHTQSIERHGLTPDDRVLSSLPLYHINGQCIGTIGPLATADTIALARQVLGPGPEQLRKLRGVVALQCVHECGDGFFRRIE